MQTFQASNFTGYLGQSLRFQCLDSQEKPAGPVITGCVREIRREGRRVAISLWIPAQNRIRTYYAKELYYRGSGR